MKFKLSSMVQTSNSVMKWLTLPHMNIILQV